MDGKRRLPLVASGPAADAAPARPRWQWIAFGALATLVLWIPLAAAGLALARKAVGGDATPRATVGEGLSLAVASALTLGTACLGGGALLGRFSPSARPHRDAAASGVAVAAVAIAASWASGGVAGGALVLDGAVVAALAASFAAVGGWLGAAAKNRNPR